MKFWKWLKVTDEMHGRWHHPWVGRKLDEEVARGQGADDRTNARMRHHWTARRWDEEEGIFFFFIFLKNKNFKNICLF